MCRGGSVSKLKHPAFGKLVICAGRVSRANSKQRNIYAPVSTKSSES